MVRNVPQKFEDKGGKQWNFTAGKIEELAEQVGISKLDRGNNEIKKNQPFFISVVLVFSSSGKDTSKLDFPTTVSDLELAVACFTFFLLNKPSKELYFWWFLKPLNFWLFLRYKTGTTRHFWYRLCRQESLPNSSSELLLDTAHGGCFCNCSKQANSTALFLPLLKSTSKSSITFAATCELPVLTPLGAFELFFECLMESLLKRSFTSDRLSDLLDISHRFPPRSFTK